MSTAVPPPNFASLDLQLADTPTWQQTEETTRRSIAAQPPAPSPPVAIVCDSRITRARRWLRPGLIRRIRIALASLLDPRSWDEKLAEQRLLTSCVAEYHGEIDWHMRQADIRFWKAHSIDRWRFTAALVRAREKTT